jgi:hypothetical protein
VLAQKKKKILYNMVIARHIVACKMEFVNDWILQPQPTYHSKFVNLSEMKSSAQPVYYERTKLSRKTLLLLMCSISNSDTWISSKYNNIWLITRWFSLFLRLAEWGSCNFEELAWLVWPIVILNPCSHGIWQITMESGPFYFWIQEH